MAITGLGSPRTRTVLTRTSFRVTILSAPMIGLTITIACLALVAVGWRSNIRCQRQTFAKALLIVLSFWERRTLHPGRCPHALSLCLSTARKSSKRSRCWARTRGAPSTILRWNRWRISLVRLTSSSMVEMACSSFGTSKSWSKTHNEAAIQEVRGDPLKIHNNPGAGTEKTTLI